MGVLNQELSFEEVRYLIGSQVSRLNGYDVALSFRGPAAKTLLRAKATRLFRLVPLCNGRYFDGPWWTTKRVFNELLHTTVEFDKGGGAYLRNLIRNTLALPGSNQLCVVEIELKKDVYAWVGEASALFGHRGGVEQVFLPNLCSDGAGWSEHARVVRTYWLNF